VTPFRLPENLKRRVKDSIRRSKFDPVLTKVIKAMKSKRRATINGIAICKFTLKQWQQGTTIRGHKHLTLYGFPLFCLAELQFESTWLPPVITDKDLSTTKK
tara:strand:+ start:636 stop:941 length:306 start_codon:yes stop_codon:yes gene_type:complete